MELIYLMLFLPMKQDTFHESEESHSSQGLVVFILAAQRKRFTESVRERAARLNVLAVYQAKGIICLKRRPEHHRNNLASIVHALACLLLLLCTNESFH